MPAQSDLCRPAFSIKSPQEIVARIHQLKAGQEDFFGFQASDLISFLPFAEAREFLKPEATEGQWRPNARDDGSVKALMLGYMPFAWEKANDCRGLSANRSIEHMTAWLWMLGDDLADKMDGLYEYYGKPCLRAICEKYGWKWQQWDDGVWRNSEDDDGIAPRAPSTQEA